LKAKNRKEWPSLC